MFEFPQGLESLRRFLEQKHVDVAEIKSLRQLARISQKLAGTFVKFPSDRTLSMYPTCQKIQSEILREWPHFATVQGGASGTQKRRSAELSRGQKIAAKKAAGWIRDVAARRFDPAAERAFRDAKLGTFGAAGPVKHIDVHTYLATKAQDKN